MPRRRFALGLLTAVFAVNVYRAWTQSITCDEAFAESLFLNGKWALIFQSYDAANHVLHTVLCKLSIQAFGLSEFTLRIPSLLGGLLYLIVTYRLSRRVFGDGWQFLFSVALLGLNPLVLDFLSAARGYGMALALFLYALDQTLQYAAGDRTTPRILRAGLALGLAAAANLTLLVPGTALALLFVILLAREGRWQDAIDSFIVPGIVTCFLVVILPLSRANRDNFYVGEATLGASMKNLVALSLYHHPVESRFAGLIPAPEFWFRLFERALGPGLLLAAAVACAVLLFRWLRGSDPGAWSGAARFLLLGGGALLGSLGILIAMNRIDNVLFPAGRTGLYLIPLFTLTALALPASLAGRRRVWLTVGLPVWLIAAGWLGHYIAHFQFSAYGEWLFDSKTKYIMSLIRERHSENPRAHVRAGITWLLEPSMNFYRRVWKLDWLEPLDRKGPDGEFDLYVLAEGDRTLAEKRNLRVLYADRIAGVTLAEPRGAPRAP